MVLDRFISDEQTIGSDGVPAHGPGVLASLNVGDRHAYAEKGAVITGFAKLDANSGTSVAPGNAGSADRHLCLTGLETTHGVAKGRDPAVAQWVEGKCEPSPAFPASGARSEIMFGKNIM